MAAVSPFSPIPDDELSILKRHLVRCPALVDDFAIEHDHTGLISCRQVTCPHCGGEAPLLNTCWLSKEAGDPWGVRVIPKDGKVRFETYRVKHGRGPKGEDPNAATVNRGTGQCIHCKQAIDGDEIKRQARASAKHPTPMADCPDGWQDRLYAVVAVRLEPKLDSHGQPVRDTSGARKGEIKTSKVRYFRPPNQRDFDALAEAQRRLEASWKRWDAAVLIPTEGIDRCSNYDRGHRMSGEERWCDLFTPRQLLGHLTLTETLNRLKPGILRDLGPERGRAVVTYLQLAIEKGMDDNSRHTRWEYTRGVVKGTFSRHSYAIQWTFGEMIFRECRRTLKDEGLFTLMFNHKSQDAWETLTRALIDTGWVITACFPVESEGERSMHQKDLAAAASSIFIACRKRPERSHENAIWESAFGQTGIRHQLEAAVRQGLSDFASLRLNPVDEMVASYGKALQVLSSHWPVQDGDALVSPVKAMNEASRVVSQGRVSQITKGKVRVEDLDSETAMALTIFGIWELAEIPYDDILNLSRSLGIALDGKAGGYRVRDREIGINQAVGHPGRRPRTTGGNEGSQAPLVRAGSKLRLALPEERHRARLSAPQTDWDRLQGLIAAYRDGDIPVARAHLQTHAAEHAECILDLLEVWAAEARDPDLKKQARAALYGLGR